MYGNHVASVYTMCNSERDRNDLKMSVKYNTYFVLRDLNSLPHYFQFVLHQEPVEITSQIVNKLHL